MDLEDALGIASIGFAVAVGSVITPLVLKALWLWFQWAWTAI